MTYQANNLYDYKSFIVNTATTDYDVKTNQTDLWKNISIAGMCRITFNYAISIKLNDATLPAIALTTSESGIKIGNSNYFDIPISYLSNIFITNTSGNNATVGILLAAPELVNA